jgi:hypothetical protein
MAVLAGLLAERRDTHDARHVPKQSLQIEQSSGPLIYRNTEPSLVGDDVAETLNGGAHNDTADQTTFNLRQVH